VGIAALVVGWLVYDTLARTSLVDREAAFAVVGFVLILAMGCGLMLALPARTAYIHVGGLFGTIMATNVWMRILPPQRRMIAAAARGEAIDPSLGAGAKQRSKHNTFLAVPTTFIMISNHFPTATYGSHYALSVLGALILLGWGAAWVLRRA
ncbi:MAG TPA: urate hydroxylase PuuD, partial [Vicinamibacterales bacterium]